MQTQHAYGALVRQHVQQALVQQALVQQHVLKASF
jgi:hypothetical protein